jgi:uncharacterized protein
MSRERILNVFTPKYFSLFPLFEKNAVNLVEASEQLKLLMVTSDPEKQGEIVNRIRELEKTGEKVSKDTYTFLHTLFVIPFDREDISELINKIDDVLDYINSIARMVKLYKIAETYPVYSEMAEVVCLAAKEISNCLEHLKDINSYKSLIINGCANIRDLEKSADEIFYSGILNLFIDRANAIGLTKRKDILDTFMKCIGETKEVAEVLRTIQIKVA